MKTKFFIIAITLFVLHGKLHAQNKEAIEKRIMEQKPGDYIKTPAIDNFDGTWIWKSGNSVFKLILIKKPKSEISNHSQSPFYVDFILGACLYIKNGKEVINTMGNLAAKPTFGGIVKDNTLDLAFREPEREIAGRANLQLSADGKTAVWKMNIKATESEIQTNPGTLYGLPSDITLTKLK